MARMEGFGSTGVVILVPLGTKAPAEVAFTQRHFAGEKHVDSTITQYKERLVTLNFNGLTITVDLP